MPLSLPIIRIKSLSSLQSRGEGYVNWLDERELCRNTWRNMAINPG
jgi:hypothetical protein